MPGSYCSRLIKSVPNTTQPNTVNHFIYFYYSRDQVFNKQCVITSDAKKVLLPPPLPKSVYRTIVPQSLFEILCTKTYFDEYGVFSCSARAFARLRRVITREPLDVFGCSSSIPTVLLYL